MKVNVDIRIVLKYGTLHSHIFKLQTAPIDYDPIEVGCRSVLGSMADHSMDAKLVFVSVDTINVTKQVREKLQAFYSIASDTPNIKLSHK